MNSSSLEEVVERFQQTEAQNYSLYNYVSELNAESEQLTEEIHDLEGKIARHRSYGLGNATQVEYQQKRQQLEEIMTEIERTQKETKEVEKENLQHQRTVNVLQGGLQRIFDLLGIEPDGHWETEALTHKRGALLHRLGMLEYRAFELTQANLAVLASQHLPNNPVKKDGFEPPDLLLPSM